MTENKIPPSTAEFALIERDELMATIAEQAREIAVLKANVVTDNSMVLVNALAELERLKAKPGAAVMPELRGESDNPAELMFNRGHDHALAEVARLNLARGVPLSVRDALARRCLWLAYCWNDHNFGPAHVEARKEALKHGITNFDEANEWLSAAPTPAPTVELLRNKFPRIDPCKPVPLDEKAHCCEYTLYVERERLHRMIDAKLASLK